MSHPMQGVRSVSVGVLVDVGPKDERPTETGYSHLVEHMLFQGTPTRSAKEIAELMEEGGGAIGAFTARDYTVYHATVLDDYLPFALDVLGDMLTSSTIPQEALQTQLNVVLNEISGRESPVQRVNDLVKQALWPDSPMSKPIAGLPETLSTTTRSDLLRFMQKHYVAENMVVVAAGSVAHASLRAQVNDAFHNLRTAAQTAEQAPNGANLCDSRSAVVIADPRDLQQVYFALAWPAPPYQSEERYTWHVLPTLLGGGPTSQLYRTLREEKGLVYQIGASYHAYRSGGTLIVEGATRPATLVPTLAGVLLELFGMTQGSADLDRHFRAVQSLVSQHLISGDSAYVRMSRLALQELYFGRTLPSAEISKGLEAQTPDKVQQAAQQCLQAGLPCIALVGPVNDPMLTEVGGMLTDFGGTPELINKLESTVSYSP
ncbi:MAG: M16 family metallopeptidase [Anaerolineae bacterium]